MADLSDVSVCLAISVPDHPFHPRAARYWNDESANRVLSCRFTALGLLRLLTNPKVMNDEPLTVADAWEAYQALRALPEVSLLQEPPGCEARLADWAAAGAITPRTWTDAYLAAFALSADLRLITFDDDFDRFPALHSLRLAE